MPDTADTESELPDAEPEESPQSVLEGKRVALLGKLAGMSRKEAFTLLRAENAKPAERLSASVDIIVLGEDDVVLLGDDQLQADDIQQGISDGSIELIHETELWQRLGLIEPVRKVHPLYTPAMLAELLGVSKSIIRRWHRKQLIVPAREVRKLPYFDYHEVVTAQRLARMLASGMSPDRIEKQLSAVSNYLPDIERPLAQLSVIVEGRSLLLRQGEGLVEPGGQKRIDFDALEQDEFGSTESQADSVEEPFNIDTPQSADQLANYSADLEDEGRLDEAIDALRAALAAKGPSAEVCFRLAELLYRNEQTAAAIERYYMAIELDPEFVEARANLGCVLAENRQNVLAIAALEGALAHYPDYFDAHYHLARLFDDLGQTSQALEHWRACQALAPESHWAEEIEDRLAEQS